MSVQQSLFSLQTHGASSWARANAFLQSSYSLTNSCRRGIDFGASINLTGELKGSVGGDKQLEGGIDGSLSVGARIEAAFPVDLFGQCGLAARLMLEAEAAAYLSLDVKLSLAELRTLVAPKMGGVWLELWNAFVANANIQAGVWAKAAFAAEIGAEAVLAGNLLNTSGVSPGFTFSSKFGAGFGFSRGFHLLANFNFDSPQVILDKISSIILNALNSEAKTYRKTLSPNDASLLDEAMMIASIAIPITTRTAYEIGVTLTSNATNSTELALRSIVRSFIREGQEFLLRAISTAAFRYISKELNQPSLVTAINALSGDPHDAAVAGILDLFSMISKLDKASFENPQSWVGITAGTCDAFMNFLGTNLITNTEEWKRRVAHIWVAAVLGEGVIKWMEDPNRVSLTSAIFDSSPAFSATNSPVAQYVATKINKPAGTGLTLLDLLNYLLANAPDLSADMPEAKPVFTFLQKALNNNNASIVNAMFADFAEADSRLVPASVAPLTNSIAAALTDAITSKIEPALLTPFATNPQVGEVLNQIIRPALMATASVVLPAVSTATTTTAMVVREQVSAVLMQFFTNIILTSANSLVDKGITDGSKFLTQVAADLSKFGSLVGLVMLACSAAYGSPMTPDDVKDYLMMIRDSMDHWNKNWREKMFQNLKNVLSLGLSTDTSQVAALATNSGPPSPDGLLNAIKTFLAMSGDMLLQYGLKELELYIKHWFNLAKTVVNVIEDGAKAAFQAIQKTLQTINQGITSLTQLIDQLANNIAKFVAQIAANIQSLDNQVRQKLDQALQWIHDEVWNDVKAFLENATIGWAAGALQPIYDKIFQAVKSILDAPLKVINSFAGWIHDEITAGISSGSFQLSTIAQNIKNAALSLGTSDWNIHLSGPFLPTVNITIPGTRMIGIVIDEIMKDTGIMKILDDMIAAGTNISSMQTQLATAQARQAGTISQQQSEEQVLKGLQASGQLKISIDTPAEKSVNHNFTPCKITVSGANGSFIDSTLGLPKRISILLNGITFPYTTQNWSNDASGNLVYEGTLYSTALHLVAKRIVSAYQFAPLEIGNNLQITQAKPTGIGMSAFTLIPVQVPAKVTTIAPTRSIIGVSGSLFQPSTLVNSIKPQPVLIQPTGERPATPLELAQGNSWYISAGTGIVAVMPTLNPPGISTGPGQNVTVDGSPIEMGLVSPGSSFGTQVKLTPQKPTGTKVQASFINDSSNGGFKVTTLASYMQVQVEENVPILGHPGKFKKETFTENQVDQQTNISPLIFAKEDSYIIVEVTFTAPSNSSGDYSATLLIQADGWNDVTVPCHVLVGKIPSGSSPMSVKPGLNTLQVTIADGSGNTVIQECHFYLT